MSTNYHAANGSYERGSEAIIMLNQSAPMGATSSDAGVRIIKSRFGEISVDPAQAIHFPRGLLGMPDRFHFVLASFPSPKMQQFMLFQSLEETELSFITLPLPLENSIIAASDIRAACRDLQIGESDLAVLVIVSVHRGPNEVKLSVNARAPILIDAGRKVGVQHVFQNDTYKVQHMLD